MSTIAQIRRRRDDGYDCATIRLGAAGIFHGSSLTPRTFKDNDPPFISIEAASIGSRSMPAATGSLVDCQPDAVVQ